MNGLTKLGAVLTIIFALCVFALLADLLYVLWRRKRFRRRSLSGAGSDISGSPFYGPSKELLYFFCWKNQSRVEPAVIPAVITEAARVSDSSVSVDVDEVEKWQSLCGPSRLLYTIKEEEKEGTEISSEYYSAEGGEAKSRRSSLRDALAARDLSDEATLAATAVDDDLETPYYTPSSSPSRDDESRISAENGGSDGEETGIVIGGSFLSIKIEGG